MIGKEKSQNEYDGPRACDKIKMEGATMNKTNGRRKET